MSSSMNRPCNLRSECKGAGPGDFGGGDGNLGASSAPAYRLLNTQIAFFEGLGERVEVITKEW